jgi:hypothetical protein
VFFVVGKNYRLQDIQLSKNRAVEAAGRPPFGFPPVERRSRGQPLSSLGEVSGALPLNQPSNLTTRLESLQAGPLGHRAQLSAKAGGLCHIVRCEAGPSGPSRAQRPEAFAR